MELTGLELLHLRHRDVGVGMGRGEWDEVRNWTSVKSQGLTTRCRSNQPLGSRRVLLQGGIDETISRSPAFRVVVSCPID